MSVIIYIEENREFCVIFPKLMGGRLPYMDAPSSICTYLSR